MIEINQHDARYLCAKNLGIDVNTMSDGELVILHTADLQKLQAFPETGVVYFGDFVVESYGSESVVLITQAGGNTTLTVTGLDGLVLSGNIFPCVIWTSLANFSSCNAHFYGWKFTYTV